MSSLSVHNVAMRCAVCLLLIAIVCVDASLHYQRIIPSLEPTSDKRFFNKDYPADHRAVVDEHYVFGHPYPAVQDNSDYDSDFIKDENEDGGNWQAQMNYDILRRKIAEAKDKLERLLKDLQEKKKSWQKVTDKYAEASKAEDKTEEAKKLADQRAAGTKEKLRKMQNEVTEQVGEVNKEMTDLDECKKQLAETRRKLEELLKEKADIEKKNAAIKKSNKAAAKKASEDSAKKSADDAKKRTEDTKKKEGGGRKGSEKRKR